MNKFFLILSCLLLSVAPGRAQAPHHGKTVVPPDTTKKKIPTGPNPFQYDQTAGNVYVTVIDSAKQLYWYRRVVNGKIMEESRRVRINNIQWSREGVSKMYYESGLLMKLEEYQHDQLNGTTLYFNEEGKLETEQDYKNGMADGIFKSFKGQVMKQISMWKAGQLNGRKTTFYDNGVTQEDGYYINNQRDSLYRVFYTSGKPAATYIYKVGALNGDFYNFFESGSIQMHGTYTLSKLDGPYQEFYDHGVKKTEGQYHLDNKDGIWKYYDESGQLLKTETYKDGALLGTR